MKHFETFESFQNSASVDEGLFSFLGRLFSNPKKKRELDKLAAKLTQTRIEIGTLKLDGDPIEELENELEDKSYDYTPSRSFNSNKNDVHQTKIDILQELEDEIIDQMDEIGRENDALDKYVSKVKLESRMASTQHLMRHAEGAVAKVMAKLYRKDSKAAKDFEKQMYKAANEQFQIEEASKRDWNDKRRGPHPYDSGLSDKEQEEKEAQMKKQAKMSDDNPDAYKEMPGDEEAKKKGKVKTSKHVKRYHELYGESVVNEKAEGDRSPIDNDAIESALKKKSEETGVSIELLRIVMRRGMAAWKTGHRPGAGQEQWGYARVNSFLTKQKGTWGGADKDVAAEVGDIKESVVNESLTGILTALATVGVGVLLRYYADAIVDGLHGIYKTVKAYIAPTEWDKVIAAVGKDEALNKKVLQMIENKEFRIVHRQKRAALIEELPEFKAFVEKNGIDERVAHSIAVQMERTIWNHQEWITAKIKKKFNIEESLINEAEETYNDYPAAAKANAKKAIEWKEKYGRDEVTGGTAVGWARAHQLAKGESLSADVVSRMAQFNRHRKNSEVAAEFKDTPWKDRGHVAWLIWGGTEGVDWAMTKMDEIQNEAYNINKYSPMSYAKQIAAGSMTIQDAMKETGLPFTELVRLVKKINKDFKIKFESQDMKHFKAFESFVNENNRKEAEKIADQITDHIQDMINNDEEIDSAYYLAKDYFEGDTRNPLFNIVVDLVDKWMKKNKI